MAWVLLIVAGLFEVGWPVGLKLAQQAETRLLGIAIAAVFIGASGVFLYLAQRHIPMGTSYAVWTGIGAAGTFLVGLFYGDPATPWRFVGVALIVAGVATLKLAH